MSGTLGFDFRFRRGSVCRSSDNSDFFFFFFFFGVPQLYLWGSPLLREIFAYVTVFVFVLFFVLIQPLR